METIVIGSTRAGLTLKASLIKYLEDKGYRIDDVGMKSEKEFVPYHEAAMNVAAGISAGKYSRGIIICGTGAGSVIAAAKFKGVYPVHVTNTFMAEKAKAVNNCNCLVFGEWLTPANHAYAMLDSWMNTSFGDGNTDEWKVFLANCVNDISEYENQHIK